MTGFVVTPVGRASGPVTVSATVTATASTGSDAGTTPTPSPSSALLRSPGSVPRPLPGAEEEEAIARAIQLGAELDRWDYSPAWLQRVSGGHPLQFAFVYFVHRFRLSNRWPLGLMAQWARAIEAMYDDTNTFHTALHAADTLQAAAHLATLPAFDSLFTRDELFCLLVACAAHDVGHVARTNAFLSQIGHPYALTYNDTAVLENMSVATTFRYMLAHPRHNLLIHMSKRHARAFRALLIELVLATDLAGHFDFIDRAQHRLAVAPVDRACAPLVLDIIIKCADVSNAARPFAIAERWSQCMIEEFYRQGEDERAHGLPVTNFMDRAHPQVAKSQAVFYRGIVAPLFHVLTALAHDPSFEDTVTRNTERWNALPDAQPNPALRWFHKRGVPEPEAPVFTVPAPRKKPPA